MLPWTSLGRRGWSRELQESPSLGFTTFIDTAQISAAQAKIDELSRARDQIQARIGFLEGPPGQAGAPAPTSSSPDDTARRSERRAWSGTQAGSRARCSPSRTRTGSGSEHQRRLAEIEALRAEDGSNAEQVDRLIAQSAAVRDAQLSALRAKEVEAAKKVRAADERVVASLELSGLDQAWTGWMGADGRFDYSMRIDG